MTGVLFAPSSDAALEAEIATLGRRLARPPNSLARVGRRRQQRGMAAIGRDPQLQAALFKLVDVAPACRTPAELSDHLDAFLAEIDRDDVPVSAVRRVATGRFVGRLSGRIAAAAIGQIAHRFIAGADPAAAVPELRRLWLAGTAATVDLLGEATVSRHEGETYARRCDEALVTLHRAAANWPERPLLESDAIGTLPRVNLSVKVTALTPLVRAAAPERGREDAGRLLRGLLRRARDLGAHLHIDMESMDSREMILGLVLGLLAEDEFRDGPSAGLVLQAYLRDSEEVLDHVLEWTDRRPRATPMTIRLVKGAYWDHEMIGAAQHGWKSPVWASKIESDRCFERLTRRLIDAVPAVRPAIASHNLRSVAHAVVCARHAGLAIEDLEIQVLRGLGDDLQEALAREGIRGRTYCPVGDLVSGMAYLVRRLLENTSNDSFLASHSAGTDLGELLRRP